MKGLTDISIGLEALKSTGSKEEWGSHCQPFSSVLVFHGGSTPVFWEVNWMFDHVYPPPLRQPHSVSKSCLHLGVLCFCASRQWYVCQCLELNVCTVLVHTVACGVAAATVREFTESWCWRKRKSLLLHWGMKPVSAVCQKEGRRETGF